MTLRHAWRNLQTSFWFLPALLFGGAVLLAVFMVESDGFLGAGFFRRWPRLFGAGAEGARGLLSTVASSMITVAGVVFSITIVALSIASSQYTSRLLRNFMSDRVNQTVLGVFVGIFAYCLVVLRTIRGGEEALFVPSMAVLVALLLAFVGVAMLIYFVHHISTSIQAAHILASVTNETLKAVVRLFPDDVGEAQPDGQDDESALGHDAFWHAVPSPSTGYLQSVDATALLGLAEEIGAVLRMERGVGEFVIEGTPLVSVSEAALDDSVQDRLVSLFAIDRQRTVEQDAAFGIRLIVDVALKALSPGINDTTTAVSCIDYLSAILLKLGERNFPSRHRGCNGELRLLSRGPGYADLVAAAFDQIRDSGAGNPAILESLLNAISVLARQPLSLSRRGVLRAHADAVAESCAQNISASRDRVCIEAHLAQLAPQLSTWSEG